MKSEGRLKKFPSQLLIILPGKKHCAKEINPTEYIWPIFIIFRGFITISGLIFPMIPLKFLINKHRTEKETQVLKKLISLEVGSLECT